MSFPFYSANGLIYVDAELEGPSGKAMLRLALDTGATWTLINVAMLVAVGYDPALTPGRVQVTTGSDVVFAPLISLSLLKALGQERNAFTILAHTLPTSAAVDGLLGLDFLRGQLLTVDFRQGRISLA
jgi:predicted aspartyl protease